MKILICTFILPCLIFVLVFNAWAIETPQRTNQTISYQEKIDHIDTQISSLTEYLDTYPPSFKNDYERRKVVARWNYTISKLKELVSQSSPKTELELRLGECYRMGHNLDLPWAGINAEKHFLKAIDLDPQNIDAHMNLGRFYVNSGLNHAPAAEKEYLKALDLSGEKPLPYAHMGLVFACYYQGRFKEAVEHADIYLKYYPDDENMRDLRKIAQDKATSGESPKIILVPIQE